MEEQRNREERKEDGKQRRYKESGKEVMQGKGKKDAAANAMGVKVKDPVFKAGTLRHDDSSGIFI